MKELFNRKEKAQYNTKQKLADNCNNYGFFDTDFEGEQKDNLGGDSFETVHDTYVGFETHNNPVNE